MQASGRALGVCAAVVLGGCAVSGPGPSDQVPHAQPDGARNPVETSESPGATPDTTPGEHSDTAVAAEVGDGAPQVADAPVVDAPETTPEKAPEAELAAPTIVTAIPNPTRADVRKQLRRHWPDLQLACRAPHACVQSGDLDGDAKPDVVAIVRRGSMLGVVIFSTSAGTLRLAAGEQVQLAAEDWELNDAGAKVWTSEGTQTIDSDWRHLRGIWISPAKHRTACAGAMTLGHDALVYSGSDAAEAIIVRDAGFRWVPCGY